MRTSSRFNPLLQLVMAGAVVCAGSGCGLKLPSWDLNASGGSGGGGGSDTHEPSTGGSGGVTTSTTGTVAMSTSSSSMMTSVTTGVGGTSVSSTSGVGGSSATTGVGGGASVTTGVGGGASTAVSSTSVTSGVGGGASVSSTSVTSGVGGAPGTTTTGVGGVDPTTTGVGGSTVVSVGVGVGGGSGVGGAPQTTTTTVSSTSVSSSVTVGVGTSTSSASSGVGGNATTTSSSSGSPPALNDACPGEPHSVDVGVTLTLAGSTIGAADDFHPPAASCFGGPDSSGPDVVYAVTFQSAGTLTTTLESSNGLTGVLYAETACGDDTSLLFCGKAGIDGLERDTMAVSAGEKIYFVVDGDAGTSGDYSLSFDLEAAACGDGVLNDGEQCDDGNLVDGDGCSATCTFEVPVDASDTCPGDTVPILMGDTLDIEGAMPAPLGAATTLNYSDNYTTCDGIVYGSMSAGGADQNGNDRVFQFVPSTDGTLFLQLRNLGVEAGGFDGMLSAWANTCSPGPASEAFDWDSGTDPANGDYMGCSDHAYGSDAWASSDPDNLLTQESLTFQVTAGTPYFVVVDGYAGYSAGNFWLHAELTP
jgi:cysteine-rich repeat protein